MWQSGLHVCLRPLQRDQSYWPVFIEEYCCKITLLTIRFPELVQRYLHSKVTYIVSTYVSVYLIRHNFDVLVHLKIWVETHTDFSPHIFLLQIQHGSYSRGFLAIINTVQLNKQHYSILHTLCQIFLVKQGCVKLS